MRGLRGRERERAEREGRRVNVCVPSSTKVENIYIIISFGCFELSRKKREEKKGKTQA